LKGNGLEWLVMLYMSGALFMLFCGYVHKWAYVDPIVSRWQSGLDSISSSNLFQGELDRVAHLCHSGQLHAFACSAAAKQH